jgi:hypothetical protein
MRNKLDKRNEGTDKIIVVKSLKGMWEVGVRLHSFLTPILERMSDELHAWPFMHHPPPSPGVQ